MDILAGFIVGVVGSFHCIGMCGPIAIALPTGDENRIKDLWKKFLYNLGRVFTYGLMGAILGLLGQKIKLFGFQQFISVFLGAIILISLLLPVKFNGNFIFAKLYRLFENNIKSKIIKLFNNKSSSSFFTIGLLNGFLPCGLVYIALAGALSAGDVLKGILFMVMFGFGTLPAMLVASVAGGFINIGIRKKMTRLIPVFTLVFAVIFILRGLNLGIPYVSPKLAQPDKSKQMEQQNQPKTEEVDCCH